MPIKAHAAILLLLLPLLCSACVYPVYKTLQPDTRITVSDISGQPVAGASVFLMTNAHHAGRISVLSQMTNPAGIAAFQGRNEWRAETTFMHGSEDFSWDICVEQPGYETAFLPKAEETDALASVSVTLKHGASTPCPH